MHEPTQSQRLLLCNLNLAQKLLVATILATVGIGYLAALANLYTSSAGADGVQSVHLEEFPSVLREKGFGGLVASIEESLGKQDVIRRYHGSGAGVTRLEAALNGTMRDKIVENLAADGPPDDETKKLAEELRQMLIQWSHLDHKQRQKAYEDGIPATADGGPDLERWLADDAAGGKKKVDFKPLIQETLRDHCAGCHSPTGEAQARHVLLETFEQCNAACVEDRGMSVSQLAMTTHVHLLGFSVLFAMTGFLFSLTSYPAWVRVVFTPWTLFFQIVEICCWWLAKSDVMFAVAIFYLGGVVGIGLGVQIFGTLADLLFRRPTQG